MKLPFTHFERSVLHALNVVPTQLHPNGWAFVRAFELLCEDMGRVLSLGVFFWFFLVRRTEKTQQPTVSISVGKGNLEEWENEFVEELGSVPTLSSVNLIKGTGLFGKALKTLKKKWAQAATSDDAEPTAPVVPLSTTQPEEASQLSADDAPRSPPVVVLDSLVVGDTSPEVGEKRAAEDDCGDQERPRKRLNQVHISQESRLS
ncbi:hypothetical protein CR513_08547, partial [Mucuna pruriens]